MDLLNGSGRVNDDDPLAVARRELVVGGRDRPLEVDPLALEAVGAVGLAGRQPLLPATLGVVGVDPQQEGEVGNAGADDHRVQLLDALDPESPGDALVGRGLVDEPVADDVPSGLLGRVDDLAR